MTQPNSDPREGLNTKQNRAPEGAQNLNVLPAEVFLGGTGNIQLESRAQLDLSNCRTVASRRNCKLELRSSS